MEGNNAGQSQSDQTNAFDNSEAILSIRDLKTYFYTKAGVVKAVDGLSYNIKRGECVGIVGESACGKSVSSMSILRLISCPPGLIVGGEVLFKGEDLLKASEDRMRQIRGNQIAMIYQDATTSLNPVLTVGKQLAEPIILHHGLDKKAARQRSIQLMKQVRIPDAETRVDHYPHQFSGGMQQRIMIAMALACNPQVIIADEPTTALDVTIQAQVLEILDQLRRDYGTSIILITHNLGIVARYADHLNIMYAGRVVESGPTDAIFANPRHPYTEGLLASVPRLDRPKTENLRMIPGLPPNLLNMPTGCSFAPRCRYAETQCHQKKPMLKPAEKGCFCSCFRNDIVNEKVGEAT